MSFRTTDDYQIRQEANSHHFSRSRYLHQEDAVIWWIEDRKSALRHHLRAAQEPVGPTEDVDAIDWRSDSRRRPWLWLVLRSTLGQSGALQV